MYLGGLKKEILQGVWLTLIQNSQEIQTRDSNYVLLYKDPRIHIYYSHITTFSPFPRSFPCPFPS